MARHFVDIWLAETSKLFSRVTAKMGLILAALLGVLGPVFLWIAMNADMTWNGAQVAESIDATSPLALQIGLELRNFFILRAFVIVLAALSFAAEYRAQTIREDLIRPVPRWMVPVSKWLAVNTWIAATLLVAWVFGGLLAVVVFGFDGEWMRPLSGYGVTFLADAGFASLVLLVAVASRSAHPDLVGIGAVRGDGSAALRDHGARGGAAALASQLGLRGVVGLRRPYRLGLAQLRLARGAHGDMCGAVGAGVQPTRRSLGGPTMSMLVAILLALPLAGAEEGMWLPEQLPALGEELASLGLEVPPETLADPLGDPLGAVVSLGHCSASFISPDGLAITNHHCVEGYLRYVSDAEHDLGTTGLLAPSREVEAWAGPTARMWVVERITDVTSQIEQATRRLRGPRKDAARALAVEAERKKIIAECEALPNHRCDVASFYGGQAYRLLSALEIQDVRLVYAPPLSVGSYGGDIDNWMWPRHAGDFGVIRAHVAPDGASAPHAADNVPYRPAHHLKVQPAGVNPGDFVMVAGYPGSTDRYRLATEFRHEVEALYPAHLRWSEDILVVLRDHAARDPEAAARLSAPIGWVENKKKYQEGILDNLEGVDLISHKTTIERDLDAWIAADPKRRARLGPPGHLAPRRGHRRPVLRLGPVRRLAHRLPLRHRAAEGGPGARRGLPGPGSRGHPGLAGGTGPDPGARF
ncbi:MAG: S46 family peptidase [Deltaproteobacteria bacterium]|nr:S46 family peptidase [Deltaproteobacteria bacterium]